MNSPTGPPPITRTSTIRPVLIEDEQVAEGGAADDGPARGSGGLEFGGRIAAADRGEAVLPDVGARKGPGAGKEEGIGGRAAAEVVVDDPAVAEPGGLAKERREFV